MTKLNCALRASQRPAMSSLRLPALAPAPLSAPCAAGQRLA
jgi:hypothetical protein